MTGTAIDLQQLPAPQVVETLDFEAVLAELKADLIARAPHLEPALLLESDDLIKLLEVVAYREIVIRARVNEAAKAVMLPHAVGADLDNLASLYGIAREVLVPADETTTPPTPAVLEDDERLRRRVQLAPEGFSVAGPRGSYIFHALNADATVKDVAVESPEAGVVQVTVLSTQGDGTADQALLDTITTALNAEDVRPLCDTVQIQSADIVAFSVEATLTVFEGPDTSMVLDAAQTSVQAYLDNQHRLGGDITISGLHAALHVQGAVAKVVLTSPAADVVTSGVQAAYCDTDTSLTITIGGTSD